MLDEWYNKNCLLHPKLLLWYRCRQTCSMLMRAAFKFIALLFSYKCWIATSAQHLGWCHQHLIKFHPLSLSYANWISRNIWYSGDKTTHFNCTLMSYVVHKNCFDLVFKEPEVYCCHWKLTQSDGLYVLIFWPIVLVR